MGSRASFTLLVLLVAALLGAAWFLLGGDTEPRAALDVAPVTEAPREPERGPAAELDAARPSAPEPARAPVAEPLAGALSAEARAGALWIEGRVVFPPDTPTDEEVFVVARGKRFAGADGETNHRARVDASGRFRVALAQGTRRGSVELEARYLFLEAPARITAASLPDELVLEPRLGGCVELTLLPPAGRAFSEDELERIDARLHLTRDVGYAATRRFARVEDATPGRNEAMLRAGGVEGAPDYMLRLVSNDFAGLSEHGVGVKPGEVTRLERTLELGARLAGRAVDGEGEPVKAAEVVLHGADTWEHLYADEEGRFDKGGLPPGSYRVRVSKDDHLPADLGPYELAVGEQRRDLEARLRSGLTLAGTVTWPDGEPAADATLVLEFVPAETELAFVQDDQRRGSTDAAGAFAFAGLSESPCTLVARAKERLAPIEGESRVARKRREREAAEWTVRAEDVVPGGPPLVLVLTPGAGVRGFVVDDLGAPLEDFKVVAAPRDEEWWDDPSGERAAVRVRDSQDGAFLLEGLLDGSYQVHATARDHGTSETYALDLPWDGVPLRIVLPREASVTGVVLDTNGEPVNGARVEAQHVQGRYRQGIGRIEERADRTDDEGRFALAGLVSGHLLLHADAPGFAQSEELTLELEPGEERPGVTLRLRLPARITGTVHPSRGAVADVKIQANPTEGGIWRETRSDATGAFELADLSPGSWEVWTEPDLSDVDPDDERYWELSMTRRRSVTVELAEGAVEHVVLDGPSESDVRVTGTVTRAGAPVAGVMVLAQLMEPGLQRGGAARTDAAGRYELTLQQPGEYAFRIGEDGGDSVSVMQIVPEVETHVLDFDLPTGSIAGIVYDPEGRPLAESRVSIEGEDDARSARTDAQGRFEFGNLAAGEYTVSAGGLSYWEYDTARPNLARLARPGVRVEDGAATTGLELRLRPGGSARGSVVDAAGEPVRDVWIAASIGEGTAPKGDISVPADEHGRFEVRGLPAGRVTLFVLRMQANEDPPKSVVDVVEGGVVETRIVVD